MLTPPVATNVSIFLFIGAEREMLIPVFAYPRRLFSHALFLSIPFYIFNLIFIFFLPMPVLNAKHLSLYPYKFYPYNFT